jgi:protein-tyrosine phosphatase
MAWNSLTRITARNTPFCLLIVGASLFAKAPEVVGIPNFYRIDEHVLRGAQPSAEGFKYLAANGVKTVLDLREKDRRAAEEEKVVTAAGMRYVNVPMTGLAPPTETEITQILLLLEDNTAGSVFVHCKRGADRTGTVIAAYRIQHDHWDNAQALHEAMLRGMSMLQWPRQNYVRTFHPLSLPNPIVNASAR